MKTLTRFWQWHDTEKPEALRALELGNELLSLAARLSIDLAATLIDCREDESQSLGCRNCLRDILERFPGALRDLSLSLCPALEAMHAAVPRGEPDGAMLRKEDSNVYEWREPRRPWWQDQALAMDHAADQLLASVTGVSEIHRAAQKEFTPRDIPSVTAWYRPQPTGAGRIMRINDQLLAHDQQERATQRDKAIAMYEGLGLIGPEEPAPERLPWVSLTGCPGCGCSDDLSHMGACPLLGKSEGYWARAKAIQAEQRLLAGCMDIGTPVKVI